MPKKSQKVYKLPKQIIPEFFLMKFPENFRKKTLGSNFPKKLSGIFFKELLSYKQIMAANTARGYSREPGPGTLPKNRTTPKSATRPTNHPQDMDPCGSLVTNHHQGTSPRGPLLMIKAANTARGYSRKPGPGTLPTNRTTPKYATRPTNRTTPKDATRPTNHPQDMGPHGPLVRIKAANTARGYSREPGPGNLVPGRPPAPSPALSSPLQSLSPIPDPS